MSVDPRACLDEALLARFLERTITAAELDALSAHVDHCASCRLLVSGLAHALPDDLVPPTEQPTEPALPVGDALARGTVVGRFVLLDVIGTGGMGVVYTAYDPELDRRAALKLLRVRDPSQEANLRLKTEAQMMARIQHPNVVTVHEVGSYRDQVYLAMERVEGVTLRRWLAREPRTWREILEVLLRAGDGLAAAHEAGIVHRDFKPENVLVAADQVKVTDFGLAAADDRPAVNGGTPGYLAPECFEPGNAVDARADQFSFGITATEALGGSRPGDSDADALRAVPKVVRGVLRRALSRESAARYPSMAMLLADLRRRLARRRYQRIAAVGAMGVGAVVAAAVALAPRATSPTPPSPCATAGGVLDASWSAPRARAILGAFSASKVADADVLGRRVVASLERYAMTWRAARVATCEATAVHRAQSPALLDLRMACLDQLAVRLRVTAELLARPTPTLVQSASSHVEELPDVDDCADTTALLAATPLPTDPARRARITAATTAITEANTSFDFSRPADGTRIAESIAREVEALDYAPLLARYADLRARVSSWGKSDLRGQLGYLREAVLAAERGGLDKLKIDYLARAALLATLTGASAEGQRLLEEAHATAQRIGMPPTFERLLLATRAQLARARSDYASALEHAERWVTLARAGLAGASGARELARARAERGQLLASVGREVEGLVDLDAAIESLERVADPTEAATTRGMRAFALERAGRLADALAEADLAYGQLAAVLGETHPDVLQVIGVRMRVHAVLGHVDLAVQLARQNIQIQAQLSGPESRDTREAELDLAHVYMTTAQWRLADRAAETVLAHRVPDDVITGNAHFVRAEAHAKLGQTRAARRAYEHALRILLVADPEAAVRVRTGYGKLLAGVDPRAAIPELEAAIEAGSTDLEARATLGDLLYTSRRDRPRGRAFVLETRATCAASGEDACVRELDAWLAAHP